MKNNILIVLLIVIVTLFIQRECSRPEPTVLIQPEFIFDTDTIVKTIKPEPVYITIPGDTIVTRDTVFINDGSTSEHFWNVLSDYYTRKFYDEVLLDDSSAYILVKLELFNNDLKRVDLNFVNRRPVDIICPEPYKPVNKLFIGGGVSGNLDTFGAGPAVALNTKRDNLYTYQYDVINKTHHVSTFWKLSFRR